MVNIQNDVLARLGFQPDPKGKVIFELRIPDVGRMRVYEDDSTEYDIRTEEFSFSASTDGASRVPWCRDDKQSTPEGWLVNLPLPLHWHVHSVEERCTFRLSIPSNVYSYLHAMDTGNMTTSIIRPPSSQLCHVHQEKNWAHSFPSSHIWVQARNHEKKSGISVAGGRTIGAEAFLISYHGRDSGHDVSFTPPYSMKASPALPWPLSLASTVSPTCTGHVSWEEKRVVLEVSSVTRKIRIEATAPKNSFFGLSAPFEDGHRRNFLGQSFSAKITVKVWSAGITHWQILCEEVFEGGSLEFGADWYGNNLKGEQNRGLS